MRATAPGHVIITRPDACARDNEAHARHSGVHPQLHHPAAAGPRRAQLAPAGQSPARYRGSFAYITSVLPGGEQIPLFRLRYGGSAHSFGFAIYSPARHRYEDAVLLTGLPIGSPQEALDTACTVHLAAPGHQPDPRPPTNLRCHPPSQALPTGLKAIAGVPGASELPRLVSETFRHGPHHSAQ